MEYFKMGYVNIGGYVKAVLKSLLLVIPTTIIWSIIFLMMPVAMISNSIGLMLLGGLLSLIAGFVLTPIIGNTSLVLFREYVVDGSRIDFGDAFREARDRIKGRYFRYWLASFGVGLATAAITLLCVITFVGILILPIVYQIAFSISMIIAYQEDVTISYILQEYGKDLALLGLGVLLVTFVGGVVPVVGTLLVMPASAALNLYIGDNFR